MMDEAKGKQRICSFEYIYFARPDSTLENINVYEIREKSGKKSGNRLL
jgi:amidophosphoribosyltransferase